MRAFGTTLVLAFVALSPACKHREVVAAPFAPAPGATVQPESAIDALNPPPPPSRDLATRADTANGAPDGPKQADLDAAQGAAQTAVQRCLDALPAAATATPVRLAVKYTIGNDGKAADVEVTGGGSAEVIACGKSALDETAFPHFGGPKLTNSFTLSYSRPQPQDLAGGSH